MDGLNNTLAGFLEKINSSEVSLWLGKASGCVNFFEHKNSGQR